jgi:hypothetical protein
MIDRSKFCRRRAGRFALLNLFTWTAVALLLPPVLVAQQDERSVRAAFVYNLTKYVSWPQSNRALNICVLGEGPTGPALKLVDEGKVSEGRTLHVLLGPPELKLPHCEIVYWCGSATSRVRSLLDKAHGAAILTVGEDDDFVRHGGMMAFVRNGDSIEIEVNLESVKSSGLKVSSRLLDLALIVHPDKMRPE